MPGPSLTAKNATVPPWDHSARMSSLASATSFAVATVAAASRRRPWTARLAPRIRMPPATTPPACHQRRARQTADWTASCVCHEVPHRQVVFTIPKILRGIFRKRRDLFHLLRKTATDTLLESFRARLNLPVGRLAAGHPF
ncbi:MAG: hypothetical protein NTW21_15700 [Verrucomicrobia bacterium]|nr:hypothetical protein [Verrucomicrobiota bacterium]